MAKKADNYAAAARARLAKRARRQKFIKENKRSIVLAVLVFLLLCFLAVMTPWGPNYYYEKIQLGKMDAPGVVRPGTITDLKKLGVFYYYTMRQDDALKMFDEIGTLYYGFKISDYGKRPDDAAEVRRKGLANIRKQISNGPPFKVDDSDLSAVGEALYYVGDILSKDGGKQFQHRIYKDLYLEEFAKDHPEKCDPQITNAAEAMVRTYEGR